MPIGVDASSPARVTGSLASGGTMATASFTPPADSLLVVCCTSDGNIDTLASPTAVPSSAGLTFTKQSERLASESSAGGMSVIYTAPVATSSARTVTITHTHTGSTAVAIRVSAKVYVVTGYDTATPVDAVGANNEGGSTTNSISTTSVTPSANGLLFFNDCDWNASGTFVAVGGQTQDTATFTGEISVMSGYKSCTSGVGVTATLDAAGTAACQHKWTTLVVREAAGGGATAVPHYYYQRLRK